MSLDEIVAVNESVGKIVQFDLGFLDHVFPLSLWCFRAYIVFVISKFGQQFTFFLSVSTPLGGQKLTCGCGVWCGMLLCAFAISGFGQLRHITCRSVIKGAGGIFLCSEYDLCISFG